MFVFPALKNKRKFLLGKGGIWPSWSQSVCFPSVLDSSCPTHLQDAWWHLSQALWVWALRALFDNGCFCRDMESRTALGLYCHGCIINSPHMLCLEYVDGCLCPLSRSSPWLTLWRMKVPLRQHSTPPCWCPPGMPVWDALPRLGQSRVFLMSAHFLTKRSERVWNKKVNGSLG